MEGDERRRNTYIEPCGKLWLTFVCEGDSPFTQWMGSFLSDRYDSNNCSAVSLLFILFYSLLFLYYECFFLISAAKYWLAGAMLAFLEPEASAFGNV